ncbi:MAG: hypothetical protein O2840_00835 [bacterium]|nr:hypothetical protein [bacterium]
MKILHGSHSAHIHEALGGELAAAKARGEVIVRFAAKKGSLADLELLLGEQNLFAQPKLVVIDELHSLPKSTAKSELIEYLAKFQKNSVILCEHKELTKTELNKFPEAQVSHFPTSSTLFKWLDCLGNSSATKQALLYLQQAKETDGAGFCFAMLTRQVRLLLQTKDGGTIAGPPFVQAKLKSQAHRFSLSQLLELHNQLLEYDDQSKRGATTFSLEQELDLLTLSL